MDKATRRELLKARFRALGGIPYHSTGKAIVKAKAVQPGKRHYDPFSLALITTPPRWVSEADKPARMTPKPKRRAGPPPLAVIAAKYPKRLPRRA